MSFPNTPPPVDRSQRTLADGSPITDDHRDLKGNGQQKGYVVLSAEERARGFVRPVRRTYVHAYPRRPKYPLRDLTPEQQERHGDRGYAKFEPYPEGVSGLGRYWTQAALDRAAKGCGVATTMGPAIAETYARDPKFYSGTFCCGCRDHFPVGADGEFVWDGTDEKVGT